MFENLSFLTTVVKERRKTCVISGEKVFYLTNWFCSIYLFW